MNGLLKRLREDFRQLGYRRAFRIRPPTFDEPLRHRLEQLLTELTPKTEPEFNLTALAEAMTTLWRAQRKLAQDPAGLSRYAVQADRYLADCRTELSRAGLTVQDHDGDPYHPGRALEVIGYEDAPSCDVETVVVTVRPSVYFRGELIQMGQVIVGRPQSERPPADVNQESGESRG